MERAFSGSLAWDWAGGSRGPQGICHCIVKDANTNLSLCLKNVLLPAPSSPFVLQFYQHWIFRSSFLFQPYQR